MAEIGAGFLQEQPHLFPRTIGELLALFAKRSWPRDTVKHVSRRWGLDASTAANVVRSHASERTITKALKAEGWPLFMALGEALTGQTYQQHLHHMIEDADNVRKLREQHHESVAELEARAAGLAQLPGREGPRKHG